MCYPLACRCPLLPEPSVNDDDLEIFAEMNDESSLEDLDFFVAMNIAALDDSIVEGGPSKDVGSRAAGARNRGESSLDAGGEAGPSTRK